MTNLSLILSNYIKKSFCYKALKSITKAREVLANFFPVMQNPVQNCVGLNKMYLDSLP